MVGDRVCLDGIHLHEVRAGTVQRAVALIIEADLRTGGVVHGDQQTLVRRRAVDVQDLARGHGQRVTGPDPVSGKRGGQYRCSERGVRGGAGRVGQQRPVSKRVRAAAVLDLQGVSARLAGRALPHQIVTRQLAADRAAARCGQSKGLRIARRIEDPEKQQVSRAGQRRREGIRAAARRRGARVDDVGLDEARACVLAPWCRRGPRGRPRHARRGWPRRCQWAARFSRTQRAAAWPAESVGRLDPWPDDTGLMRPGPDGSGGGRSRRPGTRCRHRAGTGVSACSRECGRRCRGHLNGQADQQDGEHCNLADARKKDHVCLHMTMTHDMPQTSTNRP